MIVADGGARGELRRASTPDLALDLIVRAAVLALGGDPQPEAAEGISRVTGPGDHGGAEGALSLPVDLSRRRPDSGGRTTSHRRGPALLRHTEPSGPSHRRLRVQSDPAGPGRGDHVLDVVPRLPAQFRRDAVGGGDDAGRVARAARGDDRRDASWPVISLIRSTISRTETPSPRPMLSVRSRPGVGLAGRGPPPGGPRQVGHMDVVADAGAVGRRVVVAEDARRLAVREPLEDHRDEVEDARCRPAPGPPRPPR